MSAALGRGSGCQVGNVCISHTHLLLLPLGLLSRKRHSMVSVAQAQGAVAVMPPWGLSLLSFCCPAQPSPPVMSSAHLLILQESQAAAGTCWASCQPGERAQSGRVRPCPLVPERGITLACVGTAAGMGTGMGHSFLGSRGKYRTGSHSL